MPYDAFDFPDWRREMERAIARGEPIPIRVLLDEIEREVKELQDGFEDARYGYDGEPSVDSEPAPTDGVPEAS